MSRTCFPMQLNMSECGSHLVTMETWHTPNTLWNTQLLLLPCHQVEVTGLRATPPTGVFCPGRLSSGCLAAGIQQQTQVHHVSIIFIQVQSGSATRTSSLPGNATPHTHGHHVVHPKTYRTCKWLYVQQNASKSPLLPKKKIIFHKRFQI